jgi:hypothetical protein
VLRHWSEQKILSIRPIIFSPHSGQFFSMILTIL